MQEDVGWTNHPTVFIDEKERKRVKLLKFVDENFEEIVCSMLLAIIVILLGVQVSLRFLFNTALSWQEELTRILFVWFCYIGVSLGAKRMQHIRVTVFVGFLPDRVRKVTDIIADLVWLFFNVAMVYISVSMLRTMTEFRQLTPAMDIDVFHIYLIIPLAFLITTLRIIQLYVKRIIGSRTLQS